MNLRKDHYRSFQPHICVLFSGGASAPPRHKRGVFIDPSVRRVCLQIRPQAPLDSEKRGLLGSDPGDATPASERFPRDETKTTTKTQLLPMDILALATMKNAAKCDT